MVEHKHIDRICILAAALAALLAILLLFDEQLGIPKASANPGYATRLFDSSRVSAWISKQKIGLLSLKLQRKKNIFPALLKSMGRHSIR